MNMTVSVNEQNGVSYAQVGTLKQKAKAKKFSQAGDFEVNQIASSITTRKTHDKKIAINIAKAIIAIPFVGAAAAMVIKKGKPSAKILSGAKEFAKQTAILATPLLVLKANDKIADNSSKVRHSERKHPIATIGALAVSTFGIFAGAKILSKKVPVAVIDNVKNMAKKIHLDKVATKIDAAPAAVRTAFSDLASKVSIPNSVKENFGKIASKVKVPQFVKDGASKVANSTIIKNITSKVVDSGILKTVASKAKSIGNKVLHNAPLVATGVIATAVVAQTVKNAIVMSQTKSDVKKAQLKTANELVDAYSVENDSLKSANSKLASKVEQGQDAVADASASADKSDEATSEKE